MIEKLLADQDQEDDEVDSDTTTRRQRRINLVEYEEIDLKFDE